MNLYGIIILKLSGNVLCNVSNCLKLIVKYNKMFIFMGMFIKMVLKIKLFKIDYFRNKVFKRG